MLKQKLANKSIFFSLLLRNAYLCFADTRLFWKETQTIRDYILSTIIHVKSLTFGVLIVPRWIRP